MRPSRIILATGGGGVSADLTESLTLSGSQAASLLAETILSEISAYLDSQSSSKVTTSSLSESVTLNDAPDADIGAQAFDDAVAEAAILSDAQSATGIINADVVESATLTDAQSATGAFDASSSESISLAESQTANSERTADLAEAAPLTDSQDSVIGGVTGSVSESVSLSEASDATVIRVAVVGESIALNDVSASTTIRVSSVEEVAGLLDWLSATVPGSEAFTFVILSAEIIKPALTGQIQYQTLTGEIQ